MKTHHQELVKSRHSGLSGIGCFCNGLEKKDSGQAGMTVSRYYRTFHDIVRLGVTGRLILLSVLASAFLLSGCGYSVHRQSDLPFSEIQIGIIENNTLEPKLQDKLHRALTEEFMQNGIMVRPGADTKLSAVIREFDMNILSEKNEITVQYRVIIHADFSIVYKNGKKDITNMNTPFIVTLTASNALNKVLATKELGEEQAMRDIAMRLVGTLIYK